MNAASHRASPENFRGQHSTSSAVIRSIAMAALLGLIVVGSLTLAQTAQAQAAAPGNAGSWPQRPIRMIVPNGNGGLPDIVARLAAQKQIGRAHV